MDANSAGLSTAEARARQAEFGRNDIESRDTHTVLQTLRSVASEPMFDLLLLAAAVYLLIGDLGEGLLLAFFALVTVGLVFARVQPEQKLRLVRALCANGETVAMTGDGVNDAPALKAAHIGIAVGARGTDVARDVLLDGDFGHIVAGVRMGRRIFDNLRRVMIYITAIHVPIAGLALLPVLLGLPPLLLPAHVHLGVPDGLDLGVTLAVCAAAVFLVRPLVDATAARQRPSTAVHPA